MRDDRFREDGRGLPSLEYFTKAVQDSTPSGAFYCFFASFGLRGL